MKNILRLALGMAFAGLAPAAHAQYIYYYSVLTTNGTAVFGAAFTEDPEMYGEVHDYMVDVTIWNPRGWAVSQSGTNRVELVLPVDSYGTYNLRSTHTVRCSYYGYLLLRAVTSKSLFVPPPRQFTLTTRSFIPIAGVFGEQQCYRGIESTPLFYTGDNRSFEAFTSRYRTQTRAAVTPPRADWADVDVGTTNAYAFLVEDDGVPYDCWKWHSSGRAYTGDMRVGFAPRGGPASINVAMWGGAGNPLEPFAPDISWNYSIDVNNNNPSSPTYTIEGSHDCFPAHEAWIGSQQLHGYAPPLPGAYNVFTIGGCLIGFNQIRFGPRTDRIY